jgi:hypothetical protein
MAALPDPWTLKDSLEAASYVVAVAGAITGAIIFIVNAYRKAVSHLRQQLIRAWTNEGDVTATDTRFIDLTLEDHDGDIVGTLESPSIHEPFSVNADVGWRSADLRISALSGRNVVHVATARVRLSGNDNRLRWRIVKGTPPTYIPDVTVLWPNPARSS